MRGTGGWWWSAARARRASKGKERDHAYYQNRNDRGPRNRRPRCAAGALGVPVFVDAREAVPQVSPALYTHDSGNAKTGRVAVTYADLRASCPASCPLRGEGCYAENFAIYPWFRALAEAGRGHDARSTARAEARAIDSGRVVQGRAMRLHVAGDCRTAVAARIVSAAARRYIARGGGPVWTYTHAWRVVPRSAWGPRGALSVLASTERAEDAPRALARGYAPALVVDTHPADGRATVDARGVRWVPCPAQTRDNVACVNCRLCWDAEGLRARRTGITFAAHGARASSAKRRLAVIQ